MRDEENAEAFIKLSHRKFFASLVDDLIVDSDRLWSSKRPLRNVEGIRRNCRRLPEHAILSLGIAIFRKMNFAGLFSAFRRYKRFGG